jgi:uncharacterized protein YlzI (FlbEa/FlbD family)
MFVQLEHKNGHDVYLNLNHISSITPSPLGAVVTVSGDEFEVVHTPEAIIESIESMQGIFSLEEDE